MPTLNWIGKEKVVNHHRDVPYRVLEHKYGFTAENGEQTEPTGSGNKIIHGDNLEALKSLLPEYEGKIKCVYIDPPYNTGKDEWSYNDKVDHPKIKKWLGELVGKEGEDLSRHDKWLCMMYPRLKLIHRLLSKDGVIFISIDDNEHHNLRSLMDEIYGRSNWMGTIIWNNATDNNPTRIAIEHEYVVCYTKDYKYSPSEWKSPNLAVKDILIQKGKELAAKHTDLEELQEQYTKWFRKNKAYLWPFDRYKYIDFEGGVYTGSQSVHNPGKEGYRYDIPHPVTGKPCKEPLMGYRFPEDTAKRLLDSGRIIFGKDENKIIELKLYAKEYRMKLSSVISLDGRKGASELKSVFNSTKVNFKNPKPTELISELISFVTSGEDIVLDSFAGSGTTAHSVLKLNQDDGGSRKFILVEMEDYAKTITKKRVSYVLRDYRAGDRKGKGTIPGFDFYEVGPALFDENENLNEEVGLQKIREYIWFSETRTPFTDSGSEQYLLGKKDDSVYYFIYEKDRLTTLDYDALELVKTKGEQYIIYADNCLLPTDFMAKHNIIFKKIPRDITRF
jgi:adenine-specific DNA-methyltransferase